MMMLSWLRGDVVVAGGAGAGTVLLSARKRRALDAMRPHRRMLASCPYLHKASSEALADALARADAWDASPFDGDAAL